MTTYAPSRTLRTTLSVAVVALAAAIAGCTSVPADTAAPGAGEATIELSAAGFPITIGSALGDAEIDAPPVRVATWGWSTQDAVLALGVVPVAMPINLYGGNEDGILPWTADAIEALGGEVPQLLTGTDTGEIDVEEFVKAAPDVILAPYSGLTQEEFDTLSKIAPVVAYPDQPWAVTWQEQATIVGEALGKSDEAAALIGDIDKGIAELAAEFPELDGQSFVYGAVNQAEVFNVFRADDPRVQLLTQLNMTVADSVATLDADPSAGSYFYGLSFENLSKLDSDVLVAYFGTQAEADAFVADPLVAAMPQVNENRFAPIVGESFVMASSAPTVLSIPWMLDQYVPQLAAATKSGR